MESLLGQRVEVYWNSRKRVYSIRALKTKRVVHHAELVQLRDVTFRVSEAGRQRVLASGIKNTHALCVGTLVNASTLTEEIDLQPLIDAGEPVYYNPWLTRHFMHLTERTPYTGCRELAMFYTTTLVERGVWKRLPLLTAIEPQEIVANA